MKRGQQCEPKVKQVGAGPHVPVACTGTHHEVALQREFGTLHSLDGSSVLITLHDLLIIPKNNLED